MLTLIWAKLRQLAMKRNERFESEPIICVNIAILQSVVSASRFTIDHITPKSLGGSDELENLALACRRCNQ